MPTLIVGALGVAALIWFIQLESRGDRTTVLLVLLGALMVEAVLAGQSAEVAPGLFRAGVGPVAVRPPDVVIIAALVARFFVCGLPKRVSTAGLFWTAFIVWYGAGIVIGLEAGFTVEVVLYQAKMIFYIAGAMAVATGVDLRRLVSPSYVLRGIAILGTTFAAVALLWLVGASVSVAIPYAPIRGFGQLSLDTVTLLVGFGVVFMALLACSERRPVWALIFATMLLLAPVVADQRAAWVGLLASALVMVAFLASPSGRQRVRVTPTEIALFLLGVSAFGVIGLVASGKAETITTNFSRTFVGEANENTAAARLDLLTQAEDQIRQRPILGSGLGAQLEVAVQATGVEHAAPAHNFVLDLTLRSGLAGVLLFFAAMGVSLVNGVTVWRRSVDRRTAALAAGCVAAVIGFLAKASVESALDKFRISTAIGIALGLIATAYAQLPSRSGADGVVARRSSG